MSYKYAVVCSGCISMVAVDAGSQEEAETKIRKFLEKQSYQYDEFYLVNTHVMIS